MANTFKFGNGNWAVKDGAALAYNDENGNFKPLPFDFTRASTATRVNKDGLVETVPSGKPRIDFLNNTSGHLLLEPSRKNDLTYSEFTNADPVGWTLGFGTGTYDYNLVSYKGRGALKQTQTTSGRSYQYQNVTLLASTTYTLSMYVDISNSNVTNSGEDIMHVIADDDTGDNTAEWQDIDTNTGRVSITFTTGSDTSVQIRIGLGVTGNTLAPNQVLIYSMPQLEAGSYATSYIPTEGSSVTRSDDKCFQGGLTDKGILNNSAITIYFETDIQSDTSTNFKQIIALYNDANNVNLRLETRTNNKLYVQHSGVYISGSDFNSLELGANSVNFKKFAIYLTTTQFKIFADGNQISSTYNGSYNLDFDRIGFRSYNNSVNTLIKNKEIKLYNTALSDSELQALTS